MRWAKLVEVRARCSIEISMRVIKTRQSKIGLRRKRRKMSRG
jgi:hypothetical protein